MHAMEDIHLTTELASAVTLGSWLTFAVVWIGMSRNVKQNDRVESIGSRIGHLLPLAVAFFMLFSSLPSPSSVLDRRFVETAQVPLVVGAVLSVAGVAFAIWARLVLGRNWSATVMQKSGHELIVIGPFRYVRHPIYTGMLAAMLGSALVVGEWRGLIAVLISWLAFWRKYRLEERFMEELFGSRYLDYRRQVPALLPVFGRHA